MVPLYDPLPIESDNGAHKLDRKDLKTLLMSLPPIVASLPPIVSRSPSPRPNREGGFPSRPQPAILSQPNLSIGGIGDGNVSMNDNAFNSQKSDFFDGPLLPGESNLPRLVATDGPKASTSQLPRTIKASNHDSCPDEDALDNDVPSLMPELPQQSQQNLASQQHKLDSGSTPRTRYDSHMHTGGKRSFLETAAGKKLPSSSNAQTRLFASHFPEVHARRLLITCWKKERQMASVEGREMPPPLKNSDLVAFMVKYGIRMGTNVEEPGQPEWVLTLRRRFAGLLKKSGENQQAEVREPVEEGLREDETVEEDRQRAARNDGRVRTETRSVLLAGEMARDSQGSCSQESSRTGSIPLSSFV